MLITLVSKSFQISFLLIRNSVFLLDRHVAVHSHFQGEQPTIIQAALNINLPASVVIHRFPFFLFCNLFVLFFK